MGFFPQTSMTRPFDKNGSAHGDHHEDEDFLRLGPPQGEPFQKQAHGGDGADGQEEGRKHGEAEKAVEGDHEHAAEHHEFALGEIDDSRGVVDEGKADGDQGVGAAGRQARKKKLKDLQGQSHFSPYDEKEYPRFSAWRFASRNRGGDIFPVMDSTKG